MKLYFGYVSMLLKQQMQYKTSFFTTIFGQFLTSFTDFLGVYFLLSKFQSINGFTFSEILICFSVVLMAFAISECFVRGFDVFPRLIRSGELDRILVRPRNVVFQVLTSNMEFSRVGRLLQAVLMLCYAIPSCGVLWNGDKVLTLVLMILGGVATFSALFVLRAGISFFTIEALEFMNIFTDGSREFAKYPVSIYGGGVLRFLTFVVPVALFQYYPFLYLIGRSGNFGFAFLPLLSIVFMLPCYGVFCLGLHKYQSTGS